MEQKFWDQILVTNFSPHHGINEIMTLVKVIEYSLKSVKWIFQKSNCIENMEDIMEQISSFKYFVDSYHRIIRENEERLLKEKDERRAEKFYVRLQEGFSFMSDEAQIIIYDILGVRDQLTGISKTAYKMVSDRITDFIDRIKEIAKD